MDTRMDSIIGILGKRFITVQIVISLLSVLHMMSAYYSQYKKVSLKSS